MDHLVSALYLLSLWLKQFKGPCLHLETHWGLFSVVQEVLPNSTLCSLFQGYLLWHRKFMLRLNLWWNSCNKEMGSTLPFLKKWYCWVALRLHSCLTVWIVKELIRIRINWVPIYSDLHCFLLCFQYNYDTSDAYTDWSLLFHLALSLLVHCSLLVT